MRVRDKPPSKNHVDKHHENFEHVCNSVNLRMTPPAKSVFANHIYQASATHFKKVIRMKELKELIIFFMGKELKELIIYQKQ